MRLLRLADGRRAGRPGAAQVRRGRVLIGANEAAVHTLLPLIERFAAGSPAGARRRPARAVAPDGRRDPQPQPRLRRPDVPAARQGPAVDLARAATSSCCSCTRTHPLAARQRVTLEEVGRQTVIAHNDPSPARERVLRLYEQRHAPINIQISLPSLDGIKRAVEMRARRRAAAAPLRAGGNRARPARRGQRAGSRARRGRCGWSSAAAASCRTPRRRSSRR